MVVVVNYLGLEVEGWMVETPSTHPSIDHLGSHLLFSNLADTPPLLLLFVVVMYCVKWESWASDIAFPLRFPSHVE